MTPQTFPLEEIVRFWQRQGIAPCAEAQADGVPCPALGRPCETCGLALRALEARRGEAASARREAER